MKKKPYEGPMPLFAIAVLLFVIVQFFLVRFIRLPLTSFEKLQIPNVFFVDCFQYYRGWAVVIFGMLMVLWLAFEIVTGKISVRKLDTNQLLLGSMIGISAIAALTSPFGEQIIKGARDNYQGITVQISYLIIALVVSFAVMTSSAIRKVFLTKAGPTATVLLAIGSAVGIFQHYGVNFLESSVFRLLAAPAALAAEPLLFVNNGMAYSFFGNPNYLASVFVLLIPFVIHEYMVSSERSAYLYLGVFAAAHYTVLCAQSLGGILFLPFQYVFLLWLYHKNSNGDRNKEYIFIAVVTVMNGVFLIQGIKSSSFKEVAFAAAGFLLAYMVLRVIQAYGKRAAVVMGIIAVVALPVGWTTFSDSMDSKNPLMLKSVSITKESINIETQTVAFSIKQANGEVTVGDRFGVPVPFSRDGNNYYLSDNGYNGIKFSLKPSDANKVLRIWPFNFHAVLTADGFMYVNAGQRVDNITPYSSILPLKWDHLGTGRLYIWSQTLPLIAQSPLLGYGPDTFAIKIPQNDVVGKYNAIMNADTLIDKPHNMYLQIAFEFGLIYLIIFLIINVRIIRSLIFVQNTISLIFTPYAGALAGFLLLGFANDMKLYSGSYYWLIIGIAVGILNERYPEKGYNARKTVF